MIDQNRILADVRRALLRRLGSASPLHLKLQAIAAETGVSIDTIGRVLNGKSRKLDLALLLKIVAYCEKRGDTTIRFECFSGLGLPDPSGGSAATIRPIDRLKASIGEMLRVPASAAAQEANFWIDDRGRRVMAYPDHAHAARLALNLPVETDAIRYACVNLGWIRVGPLGFDFADYGASPEALHEAARHVMTMAVYQVRINGVALGRHEAHAALLAQAARERKADAAKAFQWTIERKPLDAIADQALARFAAEARNVENLFDFAMRPEFRDRCAVFRVEGTSVQSIWAGQNLAVVRREVIGKDVRDRKDRRYGQMVHHHVLEAIGESEPVFRDLDIALDGLRARYRRVAVPENRATSKWSNEPVFVATCIERISWEPFRP
jgi:transcriptional regulator with XRE-family HTH domain